MIEQKEVAANMAYYNRDWEDLGRNIKDAVDRAVDSRDFQKLDQTIRQVVDRAAGAANGALHKVMDSTPQPGHSGYQDVKRLYGSSVGMFVMAIIKIVIGFPFSFVSAVILLWGEGAETHEPVMSDPAAAAAVPERIYGKSCLLQNIH